jgi:hypothetical protein
MNHEADLIRRRLRTPRAAAIAGILFSLLLMASMLLIRTSIPVDPLAGERDVINHSKRITLALNLLPFAGFCFLWFVGVLRDRVGKLEDRFFATVFFGSALLFVGMIFAAGAVAGYHQTPRQREGDPDGTRRLRLGPHRNLPSDAPVRDQNGWGIHDLDLYDLVTNRDSATLDGLPRLRAGLTASVEQWNDQWDSTGLPALGAFD